mmetsp:Transcript_64996/g.174508  ORF Transcript_64996/g.174508 Transcript_64996/m.174508 type:complete len:272 (-) Transcript_64996:170-985(-)
MGAAAPAVPAATFGDDDFGGGGFGESAPANNLVGGFDGFGEAPAVNAAPAAGGAFGDDGFGGDTAFGGSSAPAADFGSDENTFGGSSANTGGDELFGTAEQSAPAPTTAPAVDLGFGGDFLGGSATVIAPLAEPVKKSSMFNNAPIVDNCETTALDKWEEEHREILRKKRLESQEKKSAALKAAEKTISDLNDNRKKTIESNQKRNKESENEFISQRDGALKAGLKGKDSWDKVNRSLMARSFTLSHMSLFRFLAILISPPIPSATSLSRA